MRASSIRTGAEVNEPRKLALVFAIIMAIGLVAWAVETVHASYPKWFGRALKVLAVVAAADLCIAAGLYVALKLLGVM